MSMGWNGLERNKLDYILTDLLPVELSELFSFSQFYTFLLGKSQQKELRSLISDLKKHKAASNGTMFREAWSTKPLKYKILKGSDSMRQMSLIQPFSALNLYLFIECYQKDLLNFLEKHHIFSIRYPKKNTDLYYKGTSKQVTEYFQAQSHRLGVASIQQAGNFFKITPFESINSFADSRIWRLSNFKYNYYAKIDYKACFDSIYTHVFSWIIERDVSDAKDAHNSNLFITIDRVLQNINGRSSNGIVVGPEFSRMIAEILLQQIDSEIAASLSEKNISYKKDYVAFRYVDDIFLFANEQLVIDQIINEYKTIGEKYLLRLNDLKLVKGRTPCLPKEWLEKTRRLSDIIAGFFFQGKKSAYEQLPDDEKFLVTGDFIPIDRLKDEIAVLVKTYSEDKRTIISYLLSTLLNNISKKKDGYALFRKHHTKKVWLLLDLALYIYAFYPSFDQTRKLISMITYMNDEADFLTDASSHEKLAKTIDRYSFIFRSGNLHDLCDWFPFFVQYKITLDTHTEELLLNQAEIDDDPIIWANFLLYSNYHSKFFDLVLEKIETIIGKELFQLSRKEPMMQSEFWYLLVFHNCPYISQPLRARMDQHISDIRADALCKNPSLPNKRVTVLVCDFLQRQSTGGNKPAESLFNWNGTKNFADLITYRTYQRTIFKRYRKNKHSIYTTSID